MPPKISQNPVSSGISNVGVPASRSEGGLQLKNGELKPLAPLQSGFASVKRDHLKQQLKFTDAVQRQADPGSADESANVAKNKTTHIHKLAFDTSRSDQYPSVQKYWDGFKTALKDSGIGRFIQRNVIHRLVDTKIADLNLTANVSENKKTTLVFELTSKSSEQVEDTNMRMQVNGKDHRIEVTFDRLRNQRSWYNPKRWFANDGRTGKVEDILAKLQNDVTRQVRLRNLGIGLAEEKKFTQECSGLLAGLPEKVSKKGATPPKVAEYSPSELRTLKNAAEELSLGQQPIQLLDKAITQRESQAPSNPPKLTKSEVAQLQRLSLHVEVQKLRAIANLCGEYSFSDQQLRDLSTLESALNNPNASLAQTIPSVSRSIREMSIMAFSALSLGTKSPEDSLANLRSLLAGKAVGILPESVILAPFFNSPQALRKQADNLRNFAGGTLEKHAALIDGMQRLEDQFDDAGHANLESREKIDQLSDDTEARKKLLLHRAEQYEGIAETSLGLYRFQGMLPILASANGEEFDSFLKDNLKSAFNTSTGLVAANTLAQVAVTGVAGTAAAVALAKGNVLSAFMMAGVGWAAANHFEGDGNTYAKRFDGLRNAILNGIASGSEEQLIQANRLIAEEKCEKTVKAWAEKQQTSLIECSVGIGKTEPVTESDSKLKGLSSNADGNRSDLANGIRNDFQEKIQKLEALANKISGTNTAIASGPDREVNIHSSLTVTEVNAQETVQKALSSAGESVATECQALQGSFEILQSAYQSEGKENGRYFTQIQTVEKGIAEGFQDDRWLGQSPDHRPNLEQFRADLAQDAPKLTNNHASHLHDLADHLETADQEAVKLGQTMRQIARGLAAPELSYMTGTTDQSIFQEGARFVQAGQLEADLKSLETAEKAVAPGGRNPYALFSDAETREAIAAPVKSLLADSKTSQAAWNKCLNTSTAMVAAVRNPETIHSLRHKLQQSVDQLNTDSADLNRIAAKYQRALPGEEPFDFSRNTKSFQTTCLREGTARLVGLPSPAPASCTAGLDILAGPLADPTLHEAVAKFLARQPEGSSKADAFQALLEGLPSTGNPADWEPEQAETWKKQVDPEMATAFLSELFNVRQGGDELSHALDGAQKLGAGENLQKIQSGLYSTAIENALQIVQANPFLKKIFQADTDIFATLATKVDVLAKHGLPDNLRDQATSFQDIHARFRNPDQRASLRTQDFETLLKAASYLGGMRENPEATQRHELQMATLNLLANIDPSLTDLKDPADVDLQKLRPIFDLNPDNSASWLSFASEFRTLQTTFANTESLASQAREGQNGARLLFQTAGGSLEALSSTSSYQVRNNRDNFLNSYKAFKLGSWQSKLDASVSTRKQVVLDRKNLKRELKASGINTDDLQYTDPKTFQTDETLQERAQLMEREQQAANLARNFLAQRDAGIIQDHKPVSPDNQRWLDQHGGIGLLREEPHDIIRRVFITDKDALMDVRMNALDDFLQNESTLQEIQPKLNALLKQIELSTAERDRFLTDRQNLLIKNGIRSTILRYCTEKGIQPSRLETNPHEAEIKKNLRGLGWSEDSFPLGHDLKRYFQEARADGFEKNWISEAGQMRSQLARLNERMDSALKTIGNALAKLNTEISESMNRRLSEQRGDSLHFARHGQAMLASARAHHANLTRSETVPSNSAIAALAMSKLQESLEKSNTDKSPKIGSWMKTTLQKLQESPDMAWEQVSNTINEDLLTLHDSLFNCTPETRPFYLPNLVARRALEFDQAANEFITDFHSKTSKLADESKKNLENLRSDFNSLTVATALPKGIVTGEDGNPRNWVRMLAKNNPKSPVALANEYNTMKPIDFLQKFQPGGELHTFFSQAQDSHAKDSLAELTAHTSQLLSGFKSLKHALDNFNLEDYQKALQSAQSAFVAPQKEIQGGDRFNSIGKILSKKPDFQGLVERLLTPASQIAIKSEAVYDSTVETLEKDFALQLAEQEKLDLASQVADEEDDYDTNPAENSTSPAARMSGQEGLQEFMRRSEFSSRRVIESSPIPNVDARVQGDYKPQGVEDIRNRLSSLNNSFGKEKLSQNQLDQLTSILSSDQALLDYQPLIEDLADRPQELREIFTQLIEAQAAKEASFSIAPQSFSPLFGNQKSSKSLKSLDQLVKELRLTRKNSNGDGNCFFHSVAMQVGSGQQQVRIGLANKMTELAKLPSDKRGSAFLDDSTLSQSSIDRTRTNAAGKKNQQHFWGENYHAIIASQVYNRPVVVVSPLQVQIIRPDGSVQEGDAQSLQQLKKERPIVLLYNGSNHWDAGEIQ